MDTNVGDMPIEIFGDYISDCLDEEWNWVYLFHADNGYNFGFSRGCLDSLRGYAKVIGPPDKMFGDGCLYSGQSNVGYGHGCANGDGNTHDEKR